MRNSKAAYWSPSKNRFNDDDRLKRHLPGPGQYRMENDISQNTGRYLLSNIRSYGTKRYVKNSNIHSLRQEPKTCTPGPGSYKPPSDFGYLDMIDARFRSNPSTA